VSPDERALLEAIRAEPEDDAGRLVYADWLEEHGQDERAELIRVQVALERDGPSEPLLAREKDLLTRRAGEWLGPLAGYLHFDRGMGAARHLRFDRGMAVACWETLPELEAGTARLAEAGDPPWVAERWLSLSGPHSEEADFAALVRSPGFGRLTRFYFGGYRASSGDQVWLLGATAAMARALAASPRSANLRRLWLINAALGVAGAEALATSPHLGRLRWLSLRHSDVPPEAVAALAHSAALTGLTGLGLSPGLAAEEEDIRALAAARGLSRLESLNLSSNRVGDARLRRLLKAPWAGTLKELWLCWNRVTDRGAKEIAACAALSGLRVLHLSGNPIRDEGAVALLESPHLRGLRELSVGHTHQLSVRLNERINRRFDRRPDVGKPERYYPYLDWEL
jgi:uncharacterized protein (TIGR02996 family)